MPNNNCKLDPDKKNFQHRCGNTFPTTLFLENNVEVKIEFSTCPSDWGTQCQASSSGTPRHGLAHLSSDDVGHIAANFVFGAPAITLKSTRKEYKNEEEKTL